MTNIMNSDKNDLTGLYVTNDKKIEVSFIIKRPQHHNTGVSTMIKNPKSYNFLFFISICIHYTIKIKN